MCRTYARQTAGLKQKVLAATNGSLALKGDEEQEEEEVKINGNGTELSSTEEVGIMYQYLVYKLYNLTIIYCMVTGRMARWGLALARRSCWTS